MVELMLTVSITSMVTMGLLGMLIHSMGTVTRQTGNDESVTEATFAVQKVMADIRDGRSASVSSGRLTVVYPALITDAATGEKIYSLSAAGTTSKTYYLDSGSHKLKRIASGVTTTLARDITAATFAASGTTVSISLTGNDNGRFTKPSVVTSRVALRNDR
jgi:hypothetical protein